MDQTLSKAQNTENEMNGVDADRSLTEQWTRCMEGWQSILRRSMDIMKPPYRPATGLTPKKTVWRKGKTQLYRYIGTQPPRYRIPVIFLYALINKPYLLDMLPGFSLIEYLVENGFDVYLLDWGEFGWEERNLSFDDLIVDYVHPAVQCAAQLAGIREVSVAGLSMGGTMAAMYAALFNDPEIRNLINIGGQIDFSDGGIAGRLLNAERFHAERVVQLFPLVPRELVAMGATMLNPYKNLVGNYTRVWRIMDEGMSVTSWKAIIKWYRDGVHFPGRAFVQWTSDLYQENKLVRKEMVLRGQTIDLSRIKANLLTVSGRRDHIVPRHQITAAHDHMSSADKTHLEYPVDHDGMVYGRLARDKVYPQIADWLASRSKPAAYAVSASTAAK